MAFVSTAKITLGDGLSRPYFHTGRVERGASAADISAAIPKSGIRGDNLVDDVAALPEEGGIIAAISFYLVGDTLTLTHNALKPTIDALAKPCADVVRSLYVVHRTTPSSVNVSLVAVFLIPAGVTDPAPSPAPPPLKRRRKATKSTPPPSTSPPPPSPRPVLSPTLVPVTPIHGGSYYRWDAMCTSINNTVKAMLKPDSPFNAFLKSDTVHDPRRRVLIATAMAWMMNVAHDGENGDSVARMKIGTSVRGNALNPQHVCSFACPPVNVVTFVVDDLLSMSTIVDNLVKGIAVDEAKGWDLAGRLKWSVRGPLHTPGLNVTFMLNDEKGDASFDPTLM